MHIFSWTVGVESGIERYALYNYQLYIVTGLELELKTGAEKVQYLLASVSNRAWSRWGPFPTRADNRNEVEDCLMFRLSSLGGVVICGELVITRARQLY